MSEELKREETTTAATAACFIYYVTKEKSLLDNLEKIDALRRITPNTGEKE